MFVHQGRNSLTSSCGSRNNWRYSSLFDKSGGCNWPKKTQGRRNSATFSNTTPAIQSMLRSIMITKKKVMNENNSSKINSTWPQFQHPWDDSARNSKNRSDRDRWRPIWTMTARRRPIPNARHPSAASAARSSRHRLRRRRRRPSNWRKKQQKEREKARDLENENSWMKQEAREKEREKTIEREKAVVVVVEAN